MAGYRGHGRTDWRNRMRCAICMGACDATVCPACRIDAARGRALMMLKSGMGLIRRGQQWLLIEADGKGLPSSGCFDPLWILEEL